MWIKILIGLGLLFVAAMIWFVWQIKNAPLQCANCGELFAGNQKVCPNCETGINEAKQKGVAKPWQDQP